MVLVMVDLIILWLMFGINVIDRGNGFTNKDNEDVARVEEYLESGNFVVAKVNGNSSFTERGHYVLIVGINENGKAIVWDPNYMNYYNVQGEEGIRSPEENGKREDISGKGIEYNDYIEGFELYDDVLQHTEAYFVIENELRQEVVIDAKGNFVTDENGDYLKIDYTKVPEITNQEELNRFEKNYPGKSLISEGGLVEYANASSGYYYSKDMPKVGGNTRYESPTQTDKSPIQFPTIPIAEDEATEEELLN